MAENRLRDKLAVAKVRRLRRAADTVALASPRLHGLRHHLPRARRQAGRPRRQARRQAHRRAQGCERHRQGPDLQGYAPAVFRTRRFDAAKTSISILPALPACSSFRPSRTRDDADPDPHPSRVAVDKAAAVAAASTLAVTPAARASELGEVRSFFHHGNRQPLAFCRNGSPAIARRRLHETAAEAFFFKSRTSFRDRDRRRSKPARLLTKAHPTRLPTRLPTVTHRSSFPSSTPSTKPRTRLRTPSTSPPTPRARRRRWPARRRRWRRPS